MSTYHNRRSSSHLKLSKASRASISRALSSPKIALTLGKKRTTEVQTEADALDSDDDMTFLQYCPTCEKQIVVPNTSVLYCSESCRRKDAVSTSPTLTSYTMATHSSTSTNSRTIVPPRTPSTLATFASKPPMLHDAKLDLDPTEWKPDLRGSTAPEFKMSASETKQDTRPPHQRTQSVAHAYLASFHRIPRGVNFSPRRSSRNTSASSSIHSSDSTLESNSSRESSVVGTPDHDNHGQPGRPLVYSASTATMALDASNVEVEATMWRKSAVNGPNEGVQGSLKKLLAASTEGRM